jgi:hypothetical protein
MSKTTLRASLIQALSNNNETWDDIEYLEIYTLEDWERNGYEEERAKTLDEEFDNRYGAPQMPKFACWSKHWIYVWISDSVWFPYDGEYDGEYDVIVSHRRWL